MKKENAAQPGRQGGNIDGSRFDIIPKDLDQSTRDRDLYQDISDFADRWDQAFLPWLDLVELRASEGLAGKSERAVARAIAQMVPPGAPAAFVPIPALAAVAGVGYAAARAAIGRMVRSGLLDFDPGNGRGIASVFVPRGRHD